MFSAPSRLGTRAVLGTSLICAIGAAVASAAWVLRPDLLFVEHVRFSGQSEASVVELRHLADLHNGIRIWEVDTARVAASVERHPWVREATVTRVFPDEVRIEVDEHVPVAILHHGGLFYVDDRGSIFLPADGRDLDYPSLTGLTPELEASHPDLPRHVVAQQLALVDALDVRGLIARDALDEVHFSRTRGFTVRSRGSRILFALEDLDGQLDRFASLLASGTVDLDRPTHVDLGPRSVAIVRPLEPPGEG
jgi:cell division protein FtsQ